MAETPRGRSPTAEDFARIETIFADALALDAQARGRVLDAACGDRHDLRAEVDALLAAHDQVAASAPADEDVGTPGLGAGPQIGAYRLVEKIGEGGMGDVYRAERADGAFVQQVAVKIMRSAIVHADLLRRFKVERQILASLHHASIVTLKAQYATHELRGPVTDGQIAHDRIAYCHDLGRPLNDCVSAAAAHNATGRRRLQTVLGGAS